MSVVGQESLMHRAWNLLMDESARSIAIFGAGGIGKTTLMKQLYSKSLATNHFQTVIWITGSSKLTFRKIQDDISKSLGLFDRVWVSKSNEEKSQLIRTEISTKESVLFLDDLWFYIDLKSLGVEGSKFIYSTRNANVPQRMGAYFVFKLNELSEEDASQLFHSKIGDNNILKDPNISEIARNLVSKCKGLPVLISTLGAAMSCRKTRKDWESAVLKIEQLRQWKSYDEITSIFKFCFDCLPTADVRYCLSYISLFPEDFTIQKRDLIDFWICERIVSAYSFMDDTLSLGYDVMQTLVRAGFLEEEENDCVKLLDMIRDFALASVTKSRIFNSAQLLERPRPFSKSIYHKIFQDFGFLLTTLFKYGNDPSLMGLSEVNTTLETMGWISSMENSIRKIIAGVPTKLPPNLLTFLLNHNPFVMIKGKFSQFMGALTVLDLSKSGVEEVPREISVLVSLKYLNLSRTWIERLPVEINALKKLKCLNLEHNNQLREIPRQVIYGLPSLRILKMFRCGYSVEELEDNIMSVEKMDIEPLLQLKHIEVFSITITCASALHKFFSNTKLLNCTQSLSLEVFWGKKWLDILPLVGKNLLVLEIRQAENLEEIRWNLKGFNTLRRRTFKGLEEVTVENCRSLVELTWVILAPNLKVLKVKNCDKMEEIISGARASEIFKDGRDSEVFAKLEVLALESLPELKSVYKWGTINTALPFRCLKKVQIIECPSLRKLPLKSNSAKGNGMVFEAEEEWWTSVWDDDYTKAAFSPYFKPYISM